MSPSRTVLGAILAAIAVCCVIAAASAFAEGDAAPTTYVSEGPASEPGDAPIPILVEVTGVTIEYTWWERNSEVVLLLGLALAFAVPTTMILRPPRTPLAGPRIEVGSRRRACS